jgi:hypothetical protein
LRKQQINKVRRKTILSREKQTVLESRLKYLKSKNKSDYKNKSEYDKRNRKYLLDDITEFTVAAGYLSEDQQKQVFNSHTLRPFFKNLFKLRIDEIDDKLSKGWTPMSEKEIEERRTRILGLAYSIINELATEAASLAPSELRAVSFGQPKYPIAEITAIFSKSHG